MNGIAASGVAAPYSREDHVHPTDTTRAPLSAIPTAATATPPMDGTAAIGIVNRYAKEDHVHPSDTSRAAASAVVPATAAEYIANSAPTKMLTSGATWSAAAPVALTDAAAVTPDFSTGIDFTWALAAAGRTLNNPTNAKPGQKGLISMSAGASGTITTWGTAWKFPGGIKPTLTVNGTDDISYWVVSSSVVHCSSAADFR
jgi:hypothetical protein